MSHCVQVATLAVSTDTGSPGGAEAALEEEHGRRHVFYWQRARFLRKPVWERVLGVFGRSSESLLQGVARRGALRGNEGFNRSTEMNSVMCGPTTTTLAST